MGKLVLAYFFYYMKIRNRLHEVGTNFWAVVLVDRTKWKGI